MTLFLYHLPELVTAGKIYKAVPPLYSVQKGKNKIYFYSNEELESYIKVNGNSKHVTRYKGLGEMCPEELWETTLDPKNRRLVPMTTDDLQKTQELFNTLMGKTASLRRQFIEENAEGEIF